MNRREWAQLGAARIEEISAELAEIAKAYADLRAGRRVETRGGGGTVLPVDGRKKPFQGLSDGLDPATPGLEDRNPIAPLITGLSRQ